MTIKFHTNDEGNSDICRAKKGNCPFGGDDEHFNSLKEARAAYEEKHKDNIFAAKNNSDYNEDIIKAEAKKSFETLNQHAFSRSEADYKTVKDLFEGKKVSDKRLDAVIINRENKYYDKNYAYENYDDQIKVNDYLKRERAKRGTPPTFKTFETFDPAIQSTMSNARAREVPNLFSNSLTKEKNNISYAIEQKTNHHNSNDPDWQKYWTHQQEKSEARLAAMFHEMKWLSENNSEFASKLTDAQKAGINSVRSDFINKKAFIGNVRKV